MRTKLAAMMLALALVSPTAAQQKPQEPSDRVQQRLEEVKARLELTPEQMEQLRPVLADEAQKLRALRDKYADGSASRRSRRNMARELKSIRSDTDERLKRILSTQQMEQLKDLREQWREEFRDRAR